MMSDKKINSKKYFMIAGLAFLLALIAATGAYLLYRTGNYPSGAEVMNHIYKGESLFHSIGNGTFYPMYDRFWCNGVEPVRYGAVLPYYLLALCQFCAGGNCLTGYLIYIGLVFFLGALVWLYISAKRNRIWVGFFLAIVWFFMPDNLHVLFVDGNLAQAPATAFLPLVIHFMCEYLFENKWKSACKIIPVYSVIIMCGINYACILLAAVVLFLIIYRITVRQKGRCLSVLGSFLIPVVLMGIWLYAMFRGTSSIYGDIGEMKMFFQSAAVSFNPFYRISMGNVCTYIGLAALLVSVFGLFFADKKSRICYGTSLLLMLSTCSVFYPVLTKLSDGIYVQMLRYVPVAVCLILYGLLLWKNLRKWILITICVFLVADMIPSFSIWCEGVGNMTAQERFERMEEDKLVEKAREITSQRIAIFDNESSAPDTQYLLAGYRSKRVQTMCSAGAQYASVSENTAMLEDAVSQGYYRYLFDRCLEMGNDSVLLKRTMLANKEKDVPELTDAAELVGYELIATNTDYLLYHIDAYETFGTICQYNGIGIGEQAAFMSLSDPDIEEGGSAYVDDYSYEELRKYKIIYLAGFRYHDKEEAQELVKKLAADGVRIVIAGDGIPADEKTRNREFLGVTCQDVLFENGYPLLYYNNKEIDCAFFARNHREWSTVYLNGLEHTKGYLYEDGRKLDFLGTAADENIYFIGLNLSYHYVLTHDPYAGEILHDVSGKLLREIPERELKELSINYTDDTVTIKSTENDVNTSIAYQQNFETVQGMYQKRNLVYVKKGTVTLTMYNPYLIPGIGISLAGIIFAVVYCFYLKKITERREEKTK